MRARGVLRTLVMVLLALFPILTSSAAPTPRQERAGSLTPEVVHAEKSDLSPQLRSIPPKPVARERFEKDFAEFDRGPHPPAVDFVTGNEFDFTIQEIAQGRSLPSVAGLSYRVNGHFD